MDPNNHKGLHVGRFPGQSLHYCNKCGWSGYTAGKDQPGDYPGSHEGCNYLASQVDQTFKHGVSAGCTCSYKPPLTRPCPCCGALKGQFCVHEGWNWVPPGTREGLGTLMAEGAEISMPYVPEHYIGNIRMDTLLTLPCKTCFFPYDHYQHTDSSSVGYHRFVTVIPTPLK